MIDRQYFSVSSNGDRWSLEQNRVSGETIVVHEANAPSCGQVTRTPVADFLARNVGRPEYEALAQLLSQSQPKPNGQLSSEAGETNSYATAMRYLNLGGRRRAKVVDDNVVSTRVWEDDPSEAEAFWQPNVETLDERGRREIALHLPSISDRKIRSSCSHHGEQS